MSAHSRHPGLIAIAVAIFALAGCQPGTGDGTGDGGLPEEVVRYNIVGTSLLSQQKWDEARAQFEENARRARDLVSRLPSNRDILSYIQQGG